MINSKSQFELHAVQMNKAHIEYPSHSTLGRGNPREGRLHLVYLVRLFRAQLTLSLFLPVLLANRTAERFLASYIHKQHEQRSHP